MTKNAETQTILATQRVGGKHGTTELQGLDE